MTTEKHPSKKEDIAENSSVEKNEDNDPASVQVPNPFEKNHAEIPQETLDNLEQFKEAQTERD